MQYAGVVRVCTGGYIDIDNNNLPTPDNLLVTIQ